MISQCCKEELPSKVHVYHYSACHSAHVRRCTIAARVAKRSLCDTKDERERERDCHQFLTDLDSLLLRFMKRQQFLSNRPGWVSISVTYYIFRYRDDKVR